MSLRNKIKFTRIEILFLVLGFLVFIVGAFISVRINRPELMPGVGAVIIVLGVIFAVIELPNILALSEEKMFNLRKALAADSAIAEHEDNTKSLPTENEKRQITQAEHSRVDRELPNQAPRVRKRFHLVEVFIVCFGTLVNGFGQVLLEWYIKCA